MVTESATTRTMMVVSIAGDTVTTATTAAGAGAGAGAGASGSGGHGHSHSHSHSHSHGHSHGRLTRLKERNWETMIGGEAEQTHGYNNQQ
jgi:hypothetical protein